MKILIGLRALLPSTEIESLWALMYADMCWQLEAGHKKVAIFLTLSIVWNEMVASAM